MKVLIIYGSFGSGHRRAAEAMLEAFQNLGIAAETRDLLDFLPGPMSKFYSSAYDFMITHGRALWRLTYNLGNAPASPYRPARAVTQRWQFTKLKNYFRDGNFTHAVCTHFTPAALFVDWRGMNEVNGNIFTIITDHESHRCWKRTGLDHYFVASENVAAEMQQIGIPERDISVSGIPISQTFINPGSRSEMRSRLDLPQTGKIALVICSALTINKSIAMLDEFRACEPGLRYLVIAGSNSARENALRKRFGNDDRFTIFGFTKQIAELMKASDLIITKPGGLIVSEALAAGLAQLLLEPIPGQEEANARYATDCGAAVRVKEKKGMYAKILKELLHEPGKIQRMCEAGRNVAKPYASLQIAETILSRFVV